MTFIPYETSREAQATRKSKRKFTTPDVPDTNLAYSLTGKRPEGVEGEMAAALRAAGVEAPKRGRRKPQRHNPGKVTSRPRRNGKGSQKSPADAIDLTRKPNPAALAAMHRIAGGAK